MNGDSHGLTVKELVLRVEGKLDAYILIHGSTHEREVQASVEARGEAEGSPAGRELQRAITEVATDVLALSRTVAAHERTIQRLIGAFTLVTTLGIGTLVLTILRIAGVVP